METNSTIDKDLCSQFLGGTSGCVFLAVDWQGERIFSNTVFSDLPKRSRGELSQEILINACRRVINSRLPETFELFMPSAEGARRVFSCAISPFVDRDGPVASTAVCIDVTEPRQGTIEAALSVQRATMEATADGILVVDSTGRIVGYNQRLLDIWRLPSSTVQGQTYKESLQRVLPLLVNGEECITRLNLILSQPESESYDELRFKDGSVLERYSRPQRLEGVPIGRVFSYRDITARVRAEEKVQEYASRLKTLADISQIVADARLDLQTILDGATCKVAEFFGDGCFIRLFSKDGPGMEPVSFHHVEGAVKDVLARNVAGIREVLDKGAVEEVLQSHKPVLISGSVEEMRSRIHPSIQGFLDRFPVHAWIVAPLEVEGQIIGFMTVFRFRPGEYSPLDLEFMLDLSDRTALAISNSIFHQETKSALRLRDDFIRLAAHELRTPLTALNLQIEVLAKKLKGSNLLPEMGALLSTVTKVSESALRLKKLVQEMLEMAGLASRTIPLKSGSMDLSLLVREGMEQFRFPEEVPKCALQMIGDQPVFGNWDRSRIKEAIRHLLNSAVFFSKGKTVQISVSKDAEEARLSLRVGNVIPEEHRLQNLEQAYHTTSIEKLGLGVYVVNEIVEAHGGRFRIYGVPGREFEYAVELPLEKPHAVAA